MKCWETGYTEGSLASRAWQEHETTKYYRVKTRDVFLWEYAGEVTEGARSSFCFGRLAGSGKEHQTEYTVLRMDISLINDAISCACLRSASSGGLFVSGICQEDRERMFVFTAQGLRSFTDTLRAYGKSIKKAPAEAGAFAAEKFSAVEPEKEWVFCVKDNGGPLGQVAGVCGGRYTGSGFWGVYTAFLSVKTEFEKRGLALSFRKWEVSGSGVRVYAQCPGLFDGGILLTDSDNGRQAFSMQAVSGDPFLKNSTVISRQSLRHTSSMSPAQFCRERMPDMISDIREWLCGRRTMAAA